MLKSISIQFSCNSPMFFQFWCFWDIWFQCFPGRLHHILSWSASFCPVWRWTSSPKIGTYTLLLQIYHCRYQWGTWHQHWTLWTAILPILIDHTLHCRRWLHSQRFLSQPRYKVHLDWSKAISRSCYMRKWRFLQKMRQLGALFQQLRSYIVWRAIWSGIWYWPTRGSRGRCLCRIWDCCCGLGGGLHRSKISPLWSSLRICSQMDQWTDSYRVRQSLMASSYCCHYLPCCACNTTKVPSSMRCPCSTLHQQRKQGTWWYLLPSAGREREKCHRDTWH